MRHWYDYAEATLKFLWLATLTILAAIIVGWLLSKGLPAVVLMYFTA